ncbi:MAG: CatB-related O-acetyltransferase [Planctomycetota bacterium]|jgi:acetyltransferase-like isoleucine patch superfamily enzyme
MSQKDNQENRSRRRKEGKEAWLIGELLFRLYGLTKLATIRRWIRRNILRFEGGGHFSRTIRRIFSVYHQVDIGMYTSGPCYYSPHYFPAGTKIGRYSGIYENTVRIFTVNHPLDRMSTHAFFFNPKLGYAKKEADIKRRGVLIGNDVFIGHNVTILPGVDKIGDGAVIGAGAVVTKDVPDFAIVAGNPAKIIKYRFSEEMQRKIKASKWWDKDITELQNNIEEFAYPLEDNENEKNPAC